MSQSLATALPTPLGRRPLARVTRRVAPVFWEGAALLGLLVLLFSTFLYRLPAVVISDMDEGTYLYAGKLLAEGHLPYRDFLLAHPPGITLLGAGLTWLFGPEIMPARVVYLALILLGMAPLYLVTRSITRSPLAGLLAVASYGSGMLLLANMGRTVKLEPLMNAFLIAAFALYALRPRSLRARALVGALLAAATLVKLVAVVPAGLLVLGDLLWIRPNRRFLRSWGAAAAGAAVVLLPAVVLLRLPGFVDDVLRSQLERPGLPLHTRLYYLRQNFVRFPPIPVALVASAYFLARSRDWRLRAAALLGLGSTLILVLAFRTFLAYYIVQALPWLAVVFAVVVWAAAQHLAARGLTWVRPALAAGTLFLAGAVPMLYGEVYYRRGDDHVSSPAQVVSRLRGGQGYVYAMFPAFALQAGRELYPWYYSADSLIPRITSRIGDDDFVQVFDGCQAVVLFPDELAAYPRARAFLEQHFRPAYQDAHWALWVRA
jgi:hypothetical protein